jgi:1-acyl-sn-glycerol-3-phosphate acyltransferase
VCAEEAATPAAAQALIEEPIDQQGRSA